MTEALSVRVTDLAANHIRQAETWWRANRLSAPNAVREEVEQAFTIIAAQPRIGARARHVKLRNVRRVYLARIKYDLYYRLLDSPEIVEVVALWHARSGKGPPI